MGCDGPLEAKRSLMGPSNRDVRPILGAEVILHMQRSVMFLLAGSMLGAGCTPEYDRPSGAESDYYQQAVSLLDPDNNPIPQTEASAPEYGIRQELCGVRAGMTMADVLSVWGRPRAWGISSAKGASLLFSHYYLTFKGERLATT